MKTNTPGLLAPTPSGMCTALRTLSSSLNQRRKFMKHNFPINFTIRVHNEEVFRLSNISRLKAQIDDLEIFVLQRLWFQINHGVLKKILRVMPEKHLSRSYIAELESRFRDAEGSFQTDLPENIQGILDRMTEQQDNVPESSWRFVAPKSLLDNFQRSMRLWNLPLKKGRKKTQKRRGETNGLKPFPPMDRWGRSKTSI
ncbi:hypothetical protein CRUP_007608 [Coryphaenoides rupestris]|nr:hypothetical protein CRUP_007608 [Coryphaenoides rupestris]